MGWVAMEHTLEDMVWVEMVSKGNPPYMALISVVIYPDMVYGGIS